MPCVNNDTMIDFAYNVAKGTMDETNRTVSGTVTDKDDDVIIDEKKFKKAFCSSSTSKSDKLSAISVVEKTVDGLKMLEDRGVVTSLSAENRKKFKKMQTFYSTSLKVMKDCV